MRKIINNVKARAIPIIAILIVGILVVAGLYVYLNPELVGAEEYWETPTGFGIWEDEITIVYTDGTTQSFKMIQDGNPLTVTHEGKAVSSILMRLRAKVTGSEYTGAEIKLDTVGYVAAIQGGGQAKGYPFSAQSVTFKVPIGSTQQLKYREISASWIEGTLIPDGSATVEFIPSGTVQYRGYPDGGDWQTATLPPKRSVPITISRTPTGSITVTLSSDL